jgi:hypothetical protein
MMSEESTTPDLVERMTRLVDAFAEGGIDAAMQVYAPGAVWDLSDAGIGVYEGTEAIRRLVEDWTSSFDDYVFEMQEALDVGGGVGLLRHPRVGGRLAVRAGSNRSSPGSSCGSTATSSGSRHTVTPLRLVLPPNASRRNGGRRCRRRAHDDPIGRHPRRMKWARLLGPPTLRPSTFWHHESAERGARPTEPRTVAMSTPSRIFEREGSPWAAAVAVDLKGGI